MAIKEVSTWDDIVEALYNFDTGDIIRLTADINLNNEYPLGVNSTNLIAGGYEGSSVTIDGNGHAILNLRTKISSPANIFYKTGGNQLTITFTNIDFVNIILAGASLIYMTSSNDTLNFQNCRFVGSRSGTAYLVNITENVILNLTRCFIDVPWQGAGQTNLSYTSIIPKSTRAAAVWHTTANYCWFREKYTGWVYNTTGIYTPGDNDGNVRIPSFSFSMFKLNGCYIDGSMTIPAGYDVINAGTRYVYYCELINRATNNDYTPSAQNVFDCDLIADVGSASLSDNTIRTCGWSGVIKKNAHTVGGAEITSYTFPSGSNMGGSITPIYATPAQMKDAQALSDLGFDIVVPSE